MQNPLQLYTFDNLAKRVLYRYAFTFAEFSPVESADISIEAQRGFYDFCEAVVRGVADEPALLGVNTSHPDQFLRPHELLNRHPELHKVRNDCQKAFTNLCAFIYYAGLYGEISGGFLTVSLGKLPKITGKTFEIYTKLFESFGLLIEKYSDTLSIEYPKCPEALSAWKLLAEESSKIPSNYRITQFVLWVNRSDGLYFLERIKNLLNLDENFFGYVLQKYRAEGYEDEFQIDEYRAKYTLSKEIGGLCIEYSTLHPTVRFVNKNCIGIKYALEHADELSGEIKSQLIKFCKTCNDCKGCTKHGKNKQFTVTVRHNGTEKRLCPEFVQMEWYNSDITTEKIDFMLELNNLQEKFGKITKKK